MYSLYQDGKIAAGVREYLGVGYTFHNLLREQGDEREYHLELIVAQRLQYAYHAMRELLLSEKTLVVRRDC